MNSIRIVQSGDFHLDSPLALHHQSFRKQRREELLQSFSRLVDFSIKTEADLLILTGDLFDSARVTPITLNYLAKEMSRFPGKIFISPGNHDPYTSASPYEIYRFPENTHIFRDYEEIHLKELDCLVCGQGFTSAYQHENMLLGKKSDHPASIKILVMHGEVTSGTCEYNPVSKESIEDSGFSYIAFGHRHEYSGILAAGRTSYAYAGIPEGRGFDELGDKGIISGEVFEKGTALSFRKTSSRNYAIINVSVSEVFTTEEIARRILDAVPDRKDIYKIELSGTVPSYLYLDLAGIEAILAMHLVYFTLTDRTSVHDSMEPISENTLRGLFMKTIRERREKAFTNEELLEEASNMGLRILSQEDF
ncbi:exonuclease SbcCD subunit D [Proteiniclasticum sp. C24MP]|uniref:metallophosphoesterase family protein n=1 Tax=Proteiniclasticum sp. C24MP TaxID=3374101 RepID=UPI0037542C90